MSQDKTALRRLTDRAVKELETTYAILDEGIVCHVAYLIESRPVIIPTLYARDQTRLLLHGSTSAGFVGAVRSGSPLSISVTHLDGIVVARSAFESSANYRSVVIHGHGEILGGEDHRIALDIIVDKLLPGRRDDIRASTEPELRQTATVAVPLSETSTKVRTGPPEDLPEDIEAPVWAGVVPMSLVPGVPEPAPDLRAGIGVPDYLNPYLRSSRNAPWSSESKSPE